MGCTFLTLPAAASSVCVRRDMGQRDALFPTGCCLAGPRGSVHVVLLLAGETQRGEGQRAETRRGDPGLAIGAGAELADRQTPERRLDPPHRLGCELQDREADALLLSIQGLLLDVHHARRRRREADPKDLLTVSQNGVLLAEEFFELLIAGALCPSNTMNHGCHFILLIGS